MVVQQQAQELAAAEAEAEELLDQLHLEHLDLLLVDEVELV
jgi:hypothetical protein